MDNLLCTIVGMQFVPPAKLLIGRIPIDTELLLRHNPENQHSEFAVEVSVNPNVAWPAAPSGEPDDSHELFDRAEINFHLTGFGIDPEEFWARPAVMLGHLGENKVPEGLATSRDITALLQRGTPLKASFRLSPEGQPRVLIEVTEA